MLGDSSDTVFLGTFYYNLIFFLGNCKPIAQLVSVNETAPLGKQPSWS